MAKLQDAVKKETKRVFIYVLVLDVIMIGIFVLLKLFFKNVEFFNGKPGMGYLPVILGAVCGGAVAVLNFFLMAVTVQAVTNIEDPDTAKNLYKNSYFRRLGLQLLWIVAVVLAPCFNIFTGIAPLFFPSLAIKVTGIAGKVNADAPTTSDETTAEETNAEETPSEETASEEENK